MPRVSLDDRHWSYFAEIEEVGAPTAEDFERGRRLAEGLEKIRGSLLNADDEHLNLSWSSLNRARIIVIPAFPIEREIVRSDGFYEYTSPHEVTSSDVPLVISSYELVRPELTLPDGPLIDAHSPTYHTPQGGFQVQELYKAVHLKPHQVAIVGR